MVIRIVARMAFALAVGHALVTALPAALWWALDSGPLADDPELVLTSRPHAEAVRVYGDHPDLDPRAAARRTVDDLERAGGFDQPVLVVTIPTGSSWVDAAQVEATEQWAEGAVATVAMRYSSAPSAAVYALRPELATESARALLTEIAGRLRELESVDRPALVVHGLSLGARAGAAALSDPELAELVDSALWQGMPGARGDAGTDPCAVSVVNTDDPVADLSWDLLRDPALALQTLVAFPGSDSARPGVGHRYRPLLAPPACVNPTAAETATR